MPKEDKGLTKGSTIPSFQLEGVNGKTYASKDFIGNPFIIYFLRGTF